MGGNAATVGRQAVVAVTSMSARGTAETGWPALLCEVGARTYAVPLADVVEVTRAVEVVSQTGDPGAVLGHMDLRGEIVPVLSARRILGLPPLPVRPSDRFVVLRASGDAIALQVDRVDGVEVVVEGHRPDAMAVDPELQVARRAGGVDGGGIVSRLGTRTIRARLDALVPK